jgi:hypothetical protein
MIALTLIAVHANVRFCLADDCALPNDCADLAKLTISSLKHQRLKSVSRGLENNFSSIAKLAVNRTIKKG